jgi:outer membrane protein TolC
MESLNFPVAVPVAAPTRFASISSSRVFRQEREAIRRFFRGVVLATLAGALAFSGNVSGADAPLTLAEAQRRAVERSRQTSAQDAAVAASREMAVAAGQLPDPVLKLGIQDLPVDGADRFSVARDSFTMRQVGVTQEFTRAEKRRLRAERFERQAEKSLAEKTATIASIQRDTALAWFDRYYAEATAAMIAEQASEVKLEIVAAESAYRAGRGTQADVFAAHSTLAALDDRASEFDRRIGTAKTVLARWVGEGAGAPLEGKPAFDSIRLDTSALDADLAHHPQITVLRKQEEIASTEARIARADKKADWSVELMYSQRGSSFSNMVSVGVSIPLQWDQRNRQDRELAAKLAVADQAKAEREEALRAHIGEVRAMVAEWENGRERLTRYERQLIPLAKERTKASFAAYRGGKTSLTDLLLARRNEIDLRIQALQLEMETARLWAQLNFLFPVEGNAPHATSPSAAASTKESR